MGGLPPRAPIAMTQNFWPSLPAPPWVDEFLDFSALRRSAHRRTVSDPITFVEVPVDPRSDGGGNGFEKLDDEQIRNMCTQDAPMPNASSSDPSSPSDHHSENDGQKGAPAQPLVAPKNEPVEGGSPPETPPGVKSSENASSETIVDPKRIKRILANRQSAQRSRVRKLHYISELERSVTTLQSEVSALSPRVAFLDHQRLLLNMDNSALKQRIAALAQDKIFKDAHQEALKKEIERLREIYEEQKLKRKKEIDGTAVEFNDNRRCTED